MFVPFAKYCGEPSPSGLSFVHNAGFTVTFPRLSRVVSISSGTMGRIQGALCDAKLDAWPFITSGRGIRSLLHFEAGQKSRVLHEFYLSAAPVRNWSSLFLNKMLNVVSDP